MSEPKGNAAAESPKRLVTILLAAIFAAEFSIMASFVVFEGHALNVWAEAAIDATLLSALLLPVLFLFVFRPLVRRIRDHEQAETALRAMRDQMEVRVQQRTADLERWNRKISLLADVSNLVQACATPEQAYQVVSHAGLELFPATTGALFIYSASRNELEAKASWGQPDLGPSERVLVPADCWALRRGREFRIEDSSTGPLCAHVPSARSGRYLCVPMIAQGEVLGVVHLRQDLSRMEPTDSTIAMNEKLVATLAERLASALTNIKLRESLRNQSIRDPLTGLFNRRYMEESLALEVLRAERRQRALVVVMLDLDHFKRFNDAYGHDAGDQVLREVGALMNSRIRGGDIACRYGGEEFALILPETNLETARRRVDQLRIGIAQLDIRYRGQPVSNITVSAGIAAFPVNGKTGEDLLHAADQALYQAKAEGRDRIVTANGSSTSS